jgi:hypothetical protein
LLGLLSLAGAFGLRLARNTYSRIVGDEGMKDAAAAFILGSLESHVDGVKRMERPRAHMLLIAVVTAALPLLSTAQEQRPPEQPTEERQVFKAGAELVVLHVNVFDGRSDAVPNLPQSAFTVYEDGSLRTSRFSKRATFQ